MVTFILAFLSLLIAYFLYGSYIERVLGVDVENKTPALTKYDGVDYLPLPWWKVFLIQLLNIAGLGPVFGAVMGALWGPAVFLWIVLGGIFIGAVHDFVSGFVSLREGGVSLTVIIEKYLGKHVLYFMLVICLSLLVVVGVIFVMGPARILADMCNSLSFQAISHDPEHINSPSNNLIDKALNISSTTNILQDNRIRVKTIDNKPFYATTMFWSIIIFLYYFLATLLSLDTIIAKVYPIFGMSLIIMVILVMAKILCGTLVVPELSLTNLHPENVPIWPYMMITVACGAISGFHATQSPMMARVITNEKYSKRVFYGAMIIESVIALIWAAAAMGLFAGNTADLKKAMGDKTEAVIIVKQISELLGTWGTILVLLGVVVLPVTTGDTAFRSARLIIADLLAIEQKTIKSRLVISLPLFGVAILLTTTNFMAMWTYFAWLNQTLGFITLLACTVYLYKNGKNYLITLIPALFMGYIIFDYILVDKKVGFAMGSNAASIVSLVFVLFILIVIQKFYFRSNFQTLNAR